jgi:putative phosphoribosyl transferase
MLILTRAEAGRRLAMGLAAVVKEPPAIIALSPGGVRVASEVARVFKAPLDVIAGHRLEVPGRSHSLFGAVADGSAIVLPARVRALGLPDDYVEALVTIGRHEVDRVARAWRNGAPPVGLAGRTVILVDDGLSEAVLVAATAKALRDHALQRLLYAAPMATPELCAALEPYCDERLLLFPTDVQEGAVICDPQFEQTTHIDVGMMIRRSRPDLVQAARI